MEWEVTPTAITIEEGGPAPGCVMVGLFAIGASILAFGSIFWLYTFSHRKDAVEHLKVLLARVAVSCIDEAKTGLARTVQNPYRDVPRRDRPAGTSPAVDISEQNGEERIILKKSRAGVNEFFAYALLIGLFIGIPVWFYVVNQASIPGWFLIIPAVPALGMVVGMVVLGRKYIIVRGQDELRVSVRFWFPLLQILLGRTVRIPAGVMRGVRVNRYEGTEFHLELVVDKDVKLPRLTGLSFNTGAIRMLPRSCIPDDSRHIGLWSVFPTGRRNKGPRVSDLYAIEAILQTNR